MKKDGNTKQLTVLVDVDELKDFQSVCRNQDMNSSQVIRMFIRDYIKKYGKKEGKK
jgi:antitoxin component of RelBE/YafQ-DinJ toxin-antitoxin module